MLETGMIITLAIMGLYFFKSTDLSKDMKNRSAQLKAESIHSPAVRIKKMAFENNSEAKDINSIIDKKVAEKLVQLDLHKKELEIITRAKEIDELTLKITTLEQELKNNSARNAEIVAEIETHMKALARLTANSIA